MTLKLNKKNMRTQEIFIGDCSREPNMSRYVFDNTNSNIISVAVAQMTLVLFDVYIDAEEKVAKLPSRPPYQSKCTGLFKLNCFKKNLLQKLKIWTSVGQRVAKRKTKGLHWIPSGTQCG